MSNLVDNVWKLVGQGPWIVLCLVVVTALERWRPALSQPSYWRQQFPSDLGAFVVASLCSKLLHPLEVALAGQLRMLRTPEFVERLPTAAKVVLVLVCVDFLQYWLHRGMHSFSAAARVLWAAHRWHHQPPMMTALAGYRGSLAHRLLFGLCALLSAALVQLHDPAGLMVVAAVDLLHQAILHANVDVSFGPLDQFISTPRWHRVHHAVEARLQHSNFGMHFTLWDRLFGTYTSPESVPADFPLGVEEAPAGSIRSVIGV